MSLVDTLRFVDRDPLNRGAPLHDRPGARSRGLSTRRPLPPVQTTRTSVLGAIHVRPGFPTEFTILESARRVIGLTGSRSTIDPLPPPD